MKIGIYTMCRLSVIPVRATHEDTSEIVTQLLFGELVTVIALHNQWVKIRIYHDNYEGWVDSKQLLKISEESVETLKNATRRQQESILTIMTPWGIQNVLQGSPILSDKLKFSIGTHNFSWTLNKPLLASKNIIELANSYFNSPYLWGGRTSFGIDCSGLTQTVYQQIGFSLPRDASQQYLVGSKVDFKQQKPGDLAFFKSEKTRNINHVGIILPNQQIIHAHGRVRIDTLNEKGIYNESQHYYSHMLISINQKPI